MLELCPIKINEDYRLKWNIYCVDYYHLCKDGVKLNDTLYRKGMFGGIKENQDYYLLLKHTEAFYPDSITLDKKAKPHLKSTWVIIDKNGTEKVNFDEFSNVYLSGGVIYSIDSKYYNIETGYYYGRSSSNIRSKDFIFLDNQFDSDLTKRGVIKINKKDGSFELFKSE